MDEQLMAKVRAAVQYASNGDPIKDAIDDSEIVEALVLLVRLVESAPQGGQANGT